MARLRQDTRLFELPCRCLVGRSTLADLRLTQQQVSSEHARISWENGRWLIRDLGSSNGTYINSRRLEPGLPAPLAVGDRLQYALHGKPWVVESLGPPEPCAVLLGANEHRWGQSAVLELPNPAACEVRIVARDDTWVAEGDGESREVRNGDVMTLGDGRWRLLLPARSPSYATSTLQPLIDMRYATLCFRVSADEERVKVSVEQGGASVSLPQRACLYTLLVLARARLSEATGSTDPDPASPDVTEDAGWMFTDELADMLKVTPMKVNVDVHRVRQLMTEARIHRADLVVERRPDTHQLRVGTQHLRIERW